MVVGTEAENMKVTKVKFSNRPYRMGGDYPSITVVFDYETKPLEGVMYALGSISHQRLRKTREHGWSIGIGSVFEDPKGRGGPIWLTVTLSIEPGNVETLQTYIDEATKIAEAAVPQGLAMKVALEQEQKRVGDAIVVTLEYDHFRYELKGAKHRGDSRVESIVSIDESGKVDLLVPQSPSGLLKSLQEIQAIAEAKRVEWDKYTPDQRSEMRRQKDIEDKKVAAETRKAVDKLRTEAAAFGSRLPHGGPGA
jgi:hypothetical protein